MRGGNTGLNTTSIFQMEFQFHLMAGCVVGAAHGTTARQGCRNVVAQGHRGQNHGRAGCYIPPPAIERFGIDSFPPTERGGIQTTFTLQGQRQFPELRVVTLRPRTLYIGSRCHHHTPYVRDNIRFSYF
jgi:hypothetical protein